MSEATRQLDRADLRRLIVIGLLSCCLYTALALINRQFVLTVPSVERPHLALQGMFALLFAGYLLALRIAVRIADDSRGLWTVVVFAVGFRLLLLWTTPIQEIDLYRYVWDGNAAACGVSPYRYSPQQVIEAGSREIGADADPTGRNAPVLPLPVDLRKLVRLSQSSPALATILRTVHFADLRTPYPPVSQVVFAMAALTTPDDAATHTHLVVMKAWIVLFDLLTIVVMVGLLQAAAVPVGWCLAYAWCPLVLKEFANSGHLDAIAVCLMTAALWQLISFRSNVRSNDSVLQDAHQAKRDGVCACIIAALLLGLGVGAKLFPILMLPTIAVWMWRRSGWRWAAIFAVATVVAALISLWPMLAFGPSTEIGPVPRHQPEIQRPPTDPDRSLPSVSGETAPAASTPAPMSGLAAFLSRWRMNDLLFLIVCENLDPSRPNLRQPWFAVVPVDVRLAVVSPVMDRLNVTAGEAAFLLARVLTLSLFGLIVLWLCRRLIGLHSEMPSAQKEARPAIEAGLSPLLEACFLTLAWFWLLAPTQNPWYWTWCLPLIPFARSRVWLWVSGLTLAYYLRFWLNAHWPDASGPWRTSLSGASFFDFVVVWFEFGPLFVGLLIGSLFRRRHCQQ